MSKQMPFLVNPRGKRRKTARKSSARPASKRRRASASKKAVPAWIKAKGFSSYGAYMASIRPNKGGKVARRRKRSTTKRRRSTAVVRRRSAAPKARRSSRRRSSGGVTGGIVGQLKQGAIDGTIVVAGRGVARAVRGRVGQAGTTGAAVEAVVGIVGGMLLRKKNGNAAKMFTAGAFSSVIEGLVKSANVPVISSALGDENEVSILGDVGSYDLGSYLLDEGQSGVSGYDLEGDESYAEM